MHINPKENPWFVTASVFLTHLFQKLFLIIIFLALSSCIFLSIASDHP